MLPQKNFAVGGFIALFQKVPREFGRSFLGSTFRWLWQAGDGMCREPARGQSNRNDTPPEPRARQRETAGRRVTPLRPAEMQAWAQNACRNIHLLTLSCP